MTFTEALAEANREWEERVIPDGKEITWKGHKLRFELSPSDCVGCFFKDKNECPDCDDGAWVEDSPWYTGTPTEEGWYVLKFNNTERPYEIAKWDGSHFSMVRPLHAIVVYCDAKNVPMWQKIEEKEDGKCSN